MIKAKKFIACLLLGVMGFSLMGCQKHPVSDPAQTCLTITIGSQNYSRLERALKEEFPRLNFEFECYKGVDTTEYLRSQLQHDDTGDIFFGTLKFDDSTCKEHLMDLSGYSFMGSYESSILNQYDVDGAIYLVPGPIMIRTMVYNKTLFEEKGWHVPTSHGELVELVKRVRAESDLTPITFGAQGLGYYFTTMTTYAQTASLANVQWRTWEENYLLGNTSCKERFQPGIDMLQKLINAGAYDVDLDMNHWDGGSMDRLIDRKAAMMAIWGGQSEFVAKTAGCADEFVLFPFYNEDGEPFLGTNISVHIGLAKRLEKPENEEKLENAIEVMKWLSTPEGMSNLNVGSADILPLTAADNRGTAKVYRDVWEANLSGMKAQMLYTGYEDVMIQASEIIQDAMRTGKSLDGLAELIDSLHQQALHTPQVSSLGSVSMRFNHEETVQLMADVLYSSGVADIALVSSGGRINGVVNWKGVNGKLYEGDLYANNITICLPGSSRNAALQVMTLTGNQIHNLLENGKMLYGAENIDKDEKVSAAFDYYWAGMNVEMEDGKISTVELKDGTQITEDGVYTVAFAEGDYTDDLKKIGSPVAQEIGCQDLFKAYLAANGSVVPPELLR